MYKCHYQLFMDGFLLQSDTSGISGSDTELMQGNYHIKILLRCYSVVTLIHDLETSPYFG